MRQVLEDVYPPDVYWRFQPEHAACDAPMDVVSPEALAQYVAIARAHCGADSARLDALAARLDAGGGPEPPGGSLPPPRSAPSAPGSEARSDGERPEALGLRAELLRRVRSKLRSRLERASTGTVQGLAKLVDAACAFVERAADEAGADGLAPQPGCGRRPPGGGGARLRRAQLHVFTSWLCAALREPERSYCGEGWLLLRPRALVGSHERTLLVFLTDAGLSPELRRDYAGRECVCARVATLLPPLELPAARARAPTSDELDEALRSGLAWCADALDGLSDALG